MVRAAYFDRNGTKKGAWSEDEDNKLRAHIEKHGHGNWRKLPKLAGLSRCGKSCRLRWMNYLRPNVKHGNYTNEEEDLIINLHKDLGNKWSMIAAKLPGRSDNEIKNHWHTHLKKRAKQSGSVSDSENENVENPERNKETGVIKFSVLKETDEAEILLAVLCSESSSDAKNDQSLSSSLTSSSSSDHVVWNGGSSQLSNEEPAGDFWTQPFFPDACTSISDEYLMTPVDLANGYVSSSSTQDMIMADDFLLSVMEFCGV